MAISLRKAGSGEAAQPRKDIYETLLRMALGLLANYMLRRFRVKQELKGKRRKAQRKVAKLASKGREVASELKEESVKGMGSREKKKLLKKGKKKAAKMKAAKKKGKKRLILLIAVAIIVAAAVRASKK